MYTFGAFQMEGVPILSTTICIRPIETTISLCATIFGGTTCYVSSMYVKSTVYGVCSCDYVYGS